MIRRLLAALADRDNAIAALAVVALLTAFVFGWGNRQQADEAAHISAHAASAARANN